MNDKSLYGLRGVSSSKKEIHEAIKDLDKGLYPNAFCKILPDILAGDPDFCNIMHADTAGTKTSLAYIYWRETGDITVWDGIIRDAVVMNLDDMACVGCIDNIILSSTIGRNKRLIPGKIIERIIKATAGYIEQLGKLGIGIYLSGGETADVGDIVRSIDVGYTTVARMPRKDLIVNDIKASDAIVGFSSSGRSTYEDKYNSGIGSNGLSSARHDLFRSEYAKKYPESFDPATPAELVYAGSKSLTDLLEIPGIGEIEIGKLALSPTRTYLPVIKSILEAKIKINGMIHCTGGGQTKVLKFVNNKRIQKNNLLKLPPLFQLIDSESSITRKEMYQVFNMGHRLEIYTDKTSANKMIHIANSYGIDAQIIGVVEENTENELIIEDETGSYVYR